MTIEPGSEWLHIESLTVVTVERQCSESGAVLMYGPIGPAFQVTRGEFRDYRQNVPVTPELLEGMKSPQWVAGGFVGMTQFSTPMADHDGRITAVFYGATLPRMDIEIGDRVSRIPAPATLRDLLVLLRALGVPFTLPVSN